MGHDDWEWELICVVSRRCAWMGWTHLSIQQCVLLHQSSALQSILLVLHHHSSGLLCSLWKWKGRDSIVFEGLFLSGVHPHRFLFLPLHPDCGGESSSTTEAVRRGGSLLLASIHAWPGNGLSRGGLPSTWVSFDWIWIFPFLFYISIEGWWLGLWIDGQIFLFWSRYVWKEKQKWAVSPKWSILNCKVGRNVVKWWNRLAFIAVRYNWQ